MESTGCRAEDGTHDCLQNRLRLLRCPSPQPLGNNRRAWRGPRVARAAQRRVRVARAVAETLAKEHQILDDLRVGPGADGAAEESICTAAFFEGEARGMQQLRKKMWKVCKQLRSPEGYGLGM